jgi:hypothetical protein
VKFISIPGVRPIQSDVGPGFRGPLPDPRESPQMEEFYAARKPTSHETTGIDGFNRFRGDVCRVEGEEKDQRTGEITQWVQRSSATDAGSHKVVWEPNGERGMVIKETRRVFE